MRAPYGQRSHRAARDSRARAPARPAASGLVRAGACSPHSGGVAVGARARSLPGGRPRARVDRHRRGLPGRPDAVPGLDPVGRRITCCRRTCSCCGGTPADYLQPAVAISGALTALGVAPVAGAAAVEAGRGRWRPSSASTCTCAAPSTASGRAARRSCWRCSSARSRSSRGRSGSSGTCSRGSCRGGTRSGCWRSRVMVFALLAYDRARREGSRRFAWAAARARRRRGRAAPVAGRAADPDRARLGAGRLALAAPPRPTAGPAAW